MFLGKQLTVLIDGGGGLLSSKYKGFKRKRSTEGPKMTVSPLPIRTSQISGIAVILTVFVENLAKTVNGPYRGGVLVWGGGGYCRKNPEGGAHNNESSINLK